MSACVLIHVVLLNVKLFLGYCFFGLSFLVHFLVEARVGRRNKRIGRAGKGLRVGYELLLMGAKAISSRKRRGVWRGLECF